MIYNWLKYWFFPQITYVVKVMGTCFYLCVLQYGMQLYQNYMHPYQGRSGCSSQSISPMVRTIFINLYVLYLYQLAIILYNKCALQYIYVLSFWSSKVTLWHHPNIMLLNYLFLDFTWLQPMWSSHSSRSWSIRLK